MGNITFAQAVFLIIKGELPSEKEAKLIDAMLVSSIDHGVTPPSCLSALTIASAGAPLNAAIAGGILAISRHHGGAIEDSMKVFLDAVRRREGNKERGRNGDPSLQEYKERTSGFGIRSPISYERPRTQKLFQLLELSIAGSMWWPGPSSGDRRQWKGPAHQRRRSHRGCSRMVFPTGWRTPSSSWPGPGLVAHL
jgi:hypothetical protein